MANLPRSGASERKSLPTGFVLDRRYRVEGLLGRGGMGYVYRVFDTARDEVVALKQLAPAHTGSGHAATAGSTRTASSRSLREARRRIGLFQREYHTLAELAHTNIISAYDYGTHGGTPYYTMELLTGGDVSSRTPFEWQSACSVLRDVASALTRLHARRLLHRDVSPSNVHRTEDGTCKLIDFGAMAAMGSPKNIVGTAPFIAPEALRQLPLDARADLYSLGALGYYLLSGQTVHAVRTLDDAFNALGYRPRPICEHVALPAAVAELVMRLVSPEPAARPQSAVEVVEHLCALAGLEHKEVNDVARAYMTNTSLVGRRLAIQGTRRRGRCASRGDSASVLLRGARGSGRTRLLDACALQAKLMGALVVHGDAATLDGRPLSTLRRLLEELHGALGSEERAEHELSEALSRALFAGQEFRAPPSAPSPALETLEPAAIGPLRAGLVEFLIAVTQTRFVMIAVDNAEHIDADSAEVLLSLAKRSGFGKLLMVVALDSEARPKAKTALDALAHDSSSFSLAPLTLAETRRLLASVFGDVPNLAVVNHRIHALSAGAPRLTVELAQHLIDVGAIRYESGGYVLPEALLPKQLPETLGEALRARVQRLSPEARALCTVLALADGMPLSSRESFLLADLPPETSERALGELTASCIAHELGGQVLLRQTALVDPLAFELGEAQRMALHARIAALAEGDPVRQIHAAEHYFGAGQPLRAIDLLLSATAGEAVGRAWHPSFSRLVDRAVTACRQFGRPFAQAFALRCALAQQILSFNEPCESEQLLSISHDLWRLSGLKDWHELWIIDDPKARLREALARAQERFEQTPERERILPPGEAIQRLVSYHLMLVGFASSTLHMEVLHGLPSMAPFAPLSSAIEVLEVLVHALRALRAGFTARYLEGMEHVLRRLADADGGGFPEGEARSIRVNILYGLALTEGTLGRPVAFEYATEMEEHPSHVINAWRAREIAHLFLCERDAAKACRQQVERLHAQHVHRQFHHGVTVEAELLAYVQAEDLSGIRSLLPALEQMAQRHAGWQNVLLIARAVMQRVRGRPEVALELFEQLLERTSPGLHATWGYAAVGQLQTLLSLGRAPEVERKGLEHLETCRRIGLTLIGHRVGVWLAEAESARGAHAQALARLRASVADAEALGLRGLLIGITYEVRARLALEADDLEDFRLYFHKCAAALRGGGYPLLAARLDRLRDRGRGLGLGEDLSGGPARPMITCERVVFEMAAHVPAERAASALRLALAATGAHGGYLFFVEKGALSLGASAEESAPPEELLALLEQHLTSDGSMSDETVDIVSSTPLGGACTGYEPVVLHGGRAGERVPVAVLALRCSSFRRWPSAGVMEAIGEQLGELASCDEP